LCAPKPSPNDAYVPTVAFTCRKCSLGLNEDGAKLDWFAAVGGGDTVRK